MIWLRRLLLIPALICFAVGIGYLGGYQLMPGAGLEWGAAIAALAAVTFWVVLRVFAMVAVTLSMLLALITLALALVAASYFFFERERDLWFNNQQELPVQMPDHQRSTEYLKSLGQTPSPYPPLDWFHHSVAQADTGLASQAPGANQLGAPAQPQTADQVWLQWAADLMMLLGGLLTGAWLGRRRQT